MVERYLEETSIHNDLILKSRESYNTELKENQNTSEWQGKGPFFLGVCFFLGMMTLSNLETYVNGRCLVRGSYKEWTFLEKPFRYGYQGSLQSKASMIKWSQNRLLSKESMSSYVEISNLAVLRILRMLHKTFSKLNLHVKGKIPSAVRSRWTGASVFFAV